MSSVKRKRSRKKKKKKRSKKKKRKMSSPSVSLFEEGDYVRWSTPGDGGDQYNEGRVIRDTGTILQVLRGSEFVLNIGGVLRPRVTKTNWRDFVEVGACLELSCGNQWLPCRVLGVQGESGCARNPRVLVVEPIFYGSTISVPLNSLRLRRPPCLNHDLMTIMQSGFGFNNACACPATWAPYSPRGTIDIHGAPSGVSLARFGESPHEFCFVLSPPCLLPDNISFVRCVRGELKFVRKSELVVVQTLEEQSVDLGSLSFALNKTEASYKDPDGLVIPCLNAREIAQEYFDIGDASSAATMLREYSGVFPKEELAEALLVMSGNGVRDKPTAIHPVSRLVWQHSVMHRADYAREDLNSLSKSLAEIMSLDFIGARVYADLRRLRNRVAIWSIYANHWGMARQLQNERESHHPVSVSLDELNKGCMRFKVKTVAPLVPVDLTSTGALSWCTPSFLTTHMGAILEVFTPRPLYTLREGERVFDQSNWVTEAWRVGTAQTQTSGGVARRLFDKERTSSRPINEMLSREAVSPSGTAVRWNACQGPLRTHEIEEIPAFPPCWAGGVVVVPCNKKRVVIISQLLRMGIESSHTPATLIITKPTLLHFWKQELESRGVSCYAYHGAKRHQTAPCAVKDKRVFITTTNIFAKWTDLSFFVNAEPFDRVERLVLDINTVMKSPHPRVLDGISRLGCRYLWMLESKPEKDHLAIALALLNIRPFSKRSGWGTDLVSDFRRRQFVHNLLYSDRAPTAVTKNLVHFLVQSVYICSPVDAQIDKTIANESLWCRQSFGAEEDRRDKRETDLLDAYQTKLWKSFGAHVPPYALPTEQQLRKSWQYLTQICWGMKVPVHVYGDLVAYGGFHVDPEFFSAFTKKWQTSEGNAIEKSAAGKVKKLLNYQPIEGNCPICMDPLHCVDASCPGALSTSVAVGVCGHMFCGECADQIFRVAEENRTSGSNDFGMGDNSVNHARCPMCRSYWDEKENPPLLLPTKRGVVFDGGFLQCGAVYEMPHKSTDTYTKSREAAMTDVSAYPTPLLTLLEGLLDVIRESAVHGRVVVLCRTPGLAKHLEEYSNFETTRAVSIHSRRTIDSRGNAIKCFNNPSNSISEIYISTSLVAGLALDGVRNFVFAERVDRRHLNDIVEFMASCCRETLASNPGFVPVVHTLASNMSYYADDTKRPASATVLLSEPTVGDTLRDFVPLLPKDGLGYIQKIHDLFEKPLPSHLEQAYGGSAVVVPIQIAELQRQEPDAPEVNPDWTPEIESAVPDEDDLVSYLTQAETEAILGAGLPLPDLQPSAQPDATTTASLLV